MKKIIFSLVTFYLFFGISLTYSQKSDDGFFIDGFFWETADINFKSGYVMGVFHGFIHTAGSLTKIINQSGLVKEQHIKDWIEEITHIFYFGCSKGVMILAIDEIYKSASNKKIPVHRLMTVVCKRMEGLLSAGEFKKELQKLRSEVQKKE